MFSGKVRWWTFNDIDCIVYLLKVGRCNMILTRLVLPSVQI